MIPIRVPGDWPGPEFAGTTPQVHKLGASHPLLFSECPACGHIFGLGTPVVLVPVGRDPQDEHKAWITAGAIAVHAVCAGVDPHQPTMEEGNPT